MASAASLGNLVVRITANAKDAEVALDRIKKGIAATFAVGAVATFSKGVEYALKNAFQLDSALARLNTIANENGKSFQYSADQIRAFSNSLNLDSISTATSLYTAFSSGAENAAEAQMDVMYAQKLAITTGTDLATATRTVAGLVNAYGSASFGAAEAAAVVYEGFKDGVGSAEDYANALGKVIPIAGQLGISAQEIAAEVAASTQTLKSAPAAATGLTQVYNELAKSSTYAGKTFKDSFGRTFQQYLKEGHTGIEGIQLLLRKFGTDQTLDLFHAKGSGTAVNQLLTSWKALQKAYKDQTMSEEDFRQAQDKVTKSVSYQATALRNQALNALGSFGDQLKPIAAQWLPILNHWVQEITPKLAAFGKQVADVGAFLARHKEVIETVVEVVAIRFIPVLLRLGAGLSVNLVTALANAGLAFFGFSARVGAAAAEVKVAEESLSASTFAMATKFESQMAAMSLAAEGMSAKTILAFKGVAAQEGILGATTATTAGGLGARFAGLGTRAIGAAGSVGMALSFISLGWDKLGFKAKTGEGFFASAVDGIRYDAGKMGEGVLKSLGAVTGGFGLFSNGVSRALSGAGAASGAFANKIISDMRTVNVNVYDAAGHIIQNLSMVQQAMLEASGAFDPNSSTGQVLAQGGRLVQRGPGLELQTAGQVAAEQAAAEYKKYLAGLDKGGGGTGLPGGGAALPGGAADKAADKLKSLKDAVVNDLEQLAKVSEMTDDQIHNLFVGLEKDVKAAGGSKGLIAYLKKQDAALEKDARTIEKYKKELDFGKQVIATVEQLGNVAQATEGIGTTFTGIANQQRGAIDQTTAFYKAMKQLEDGVRGANGQLVKLNDTSLSQLYEAGPAALANAQAILGGGAAGISQINQNQTALDSIADKLGNKGADNMYNAGEKVADGFLKGIQSKESELEKTMDKLGAKVASSIKKALGIKSPSRVFHGIGANIATGLANGIISGSRKVNAASTYMAQQTTTFGPGSVVVNAAPGQDPQQTGMLTGRGITAVLERQKAQAMVKGVG